MCGVRRGWKGGRRKGISPKQVKKKLLTDNTDRHFFWPLGFGKRNLFLHPQVKMSCFHYLLVLLQWWCGHEDERIKMKQNLIREKRIKERVFFTSSLCWKVVILACHHSKSLKATDWTFGLEIHGVFFSLTPHGSALWRPNRHCAIDFGIYF